MPLLKNPLHDFATFNYVWTLSAMYPGEVNDPKNYKGGTGKLPIVSSSGLGNRKTVTTLAEDEIGSNVEYYIDDVNISVKIVPSPMSPTSNIETISFKIVEPYSLGLFLQTMAIASRKAGFTNYYTAPYLLTLQFKGFKDDGSYDTVGTKHFVIKLEVSTMTANEGGSIHEFNCIPWNHQALGDLALNVKTEVNITGSTVAEVLSSGPRGLSTILNTREINNAAVGWRNDYDEYQILFPFDISPNGPGSQYPDRGIGAVLNNIQGALDTVNNTVSAIGNIGTTISGLGQTLSTIGQVRSGAITISPSGIISRGLNAPEGPESTAAVQVSNVLESIGASISQAANAISISGATTIGNEIGTSPMIENFNDFGTVPFEDDNDVYDPVEGIYRRGNMTAVSGENRRYSFPAGTPISEIISEVILVSEWGRNVANFPSDGAGMRPWYRIHTKVEIKSMREIENIGRPALRYIYEVYPYFVHQSSFSSVFEENNTDVLIDDAVKAYEYIYTGRNRDIINFEISFNAHYFLGVPSDGTQQTAENATTVGGTAYAENQTVFSPTVTSGSIGNTQGTVSEVAGELRETVGELIQLYRAFGGTFIDNSKTRVAQVFRNALLNGRDLETLNLTIWGDPYYLNDSDAGNYVAPPLGPNIDADLSIDYNRMACYVLVKFNNPVDYKNNLLLPDPSDQFTGIYRVETVENTFESGQFRQMLTLTRVPNMSASSVAKLKRVVDAFFAGLGAISNLASVLGAEQVAGNIDNFMREAAPFANQLVGLAEIGSSLQSVVRGDYDNIGQALVGLESFFTGVQALENQFKNTLESLQRIDFNNLTPPTSIRPPSRPTLPVRPSPTPPSGTPPPLLNPDIDRPQ